VGRALFEGMILRGWEASFLRVLLQAALEYVAILNPRVKSSIQQLRKRQYCIAVEKRRGIWNELSWKPPVGWTNKLLVTNKKTLMS